MGAYSISLYGDDTTCDVRDQFIELLAESSNAEEATKKIISDWSLQIKDIDIGPLFWLALAETQWKYGCLKEEIKAQAIAIIENGEGLERWEGKELSRRCSILATLKDKLLSPQPKPRKPRKKKLIEVPSFKVLSPDGRAMATAFTLGVSGYTNEPQTQVMIEMISSNNRGGGGVFVGNCEYYDVVLEWLDIDTLKIKYPEKTTSAYPKPSLFFNGRTVKIVYETIPD